MLIVVVVVAVRWLMMLVLLLVVMMMTATKFAVVVGKLLGLETHTQIRTHRNQILMGEQPRARESRITTHVVRLQHFDPVQLVAGRFGAQIPHAIADRHIDATVVEFVTLEIDGADC